MHLTEEQPKYIKHTLLEIMGETDYKTIIVGPFNAHTDRKYRVESYYRVN